MPNEWRLLSVLGVSALLMIVGIVLLAVVDSPLLLVLASFAVGSSWTGTAALALRYRGRIKSTKAPNSPATRADLSATKALIAQRVDDARLKQSRHEYHQERALERIEEEVRRLHVTRGDVGLFAYGLELDILFVTSNGAGLGHISRLLAIAEELPEHRRFEVLTLSKAYKQVAAPGLTVHYFPSSEATGEVPLRWNRVFRDYFQRLIVEKRPRLVVFDGTWVYTGLTDVCRGFGIPLIWVQRGMWKTDVDAPSVQRHAAASVSDEVIIPGDYAGTESVDLGRGIIAHQVGPIVRTTRDDLLSRDESCRALGLDPAGEYVLLNLGGGVLGDPTSLASAALDLLDELASEMTVVQVVSPLAKDTPEDDRIIHVHAYPVMRFARAFEFVVTAAGYNAVQESAALGIPAILVPNMATKTDDQRRRAQGMADAGLALIVTGRGDLDQAVRAAIDPERRAALRRALDNLNWPTGAAEAARIVDDILERANWVRDADVLTG
jgi:UDP-N-acetylglucosamine:LPS N-acetylglucosamine transferase